MRYAYVRVTLAALGGVLGSSADAAATNTIWASTAVPAVVDVGADSPVELGVPLKRYQRKGSPQGDGSDLGAYQH